MYTTHTASTGLVKIQDLINDAKCFEVVRSCAGQRVFAVRIVRTSTLSSLVLAVRPRNIARGTAVSPVKGTLTT
jgi:hypothetical protein